MCLFSSGSAICTYNIIYYNMQYIYKHIRQWARLTKCDWGVRNEIGSAGWLWGQEKLTWPLGETPLLPDFANSMKLWSIVSPCISTWNQKGYTSVTSVVGWEVHSRLWRGWTRFKSRRTQKIVGLLFGSLGVHSNYVRANVKHFDCEDTSGGITSEEFTPTTCECEIMY